MKSRSKKHNNLDPILILLLILIASESTSAQEVEDEREFDYSENGEKGPRKWGEMKKEWSACSSGSLQSPIDMSNERVRIISEQEKKINYRAANATVKNRGHDIQIQWFDDAGSVLINGSDYPLRQAHWHSPSEHTIHGRSYDMELHLVHLSTDPNLKNNIYVLGVLYKIGKPHKFLSKLITNIISMIDKKDEEVAVGMIDAANIQVHNKKYSLRPNSIVEVENEACWSWFVKILLEELGIYDGLGLSFISDQQKAMWPIELGRRKYYRYMGSLTVLPCTEGVIWAINKKVKTVSVDQVKLLREAAHDVS